MARDDSLARWQSVWYRSPVLLLDFYGDYIALVKATLARLGYAADEATADEDVAVRYYNLFHRLVEPVPRAVHVAPSLVCPPEHETGFDEVKRKIADGVDLRPHLSSRLADLDYNDAMLNDWGIHHLHLGTVLMDNGFVERTGPLLYARFVRDAAYLLAIVGHGAWTNTDFIECLHTHWPSVIAPWKAHGLSPVHLKAEHRKNIRRKNGNVTVTTQDGTAYFPPGGGLTSSGGAVQVLRETDYTRFIVLGWQKIVLEHENEIRERASAKGVATPEPWQFQLKIEDGQGFAVAEAENLSIPLGPLG